MPFYCCFFFLSFRWESGFIDNKMFFSRICLFCSWCNPCKVLMPRIETVIQENDGKVHLAKVRTSWYDICLRQIIELFETNNCRGFCRSSLYRLLLHFYLSFCACAMNTWTKANRFFFLFSFPKSGWHWWAHRHCRWLWNSIRASASCD